MNRHAFFASNNSWTIALPELARENETVAAAWVMHCDAGQLVKLCSMLVSFGLH